MKYLIGAFLIVIPLLVPLDASAQGVSIKANLGWTEAGPDLPTVSGYTYRYYVDGSQSGSVLPFAIAWKSGAQVGDFDASTPIPSFTPGVHQLTLTAENLAGVSLPSNPLVFTFLVAPGQPKGLKLEQPGPGALLLIPNDQLALVLSGPVKISREVQNER